jgi:hypothetical protein
MTNLNRLLGWLSTNTLRSIKADLEFEWAAAVKRGRPSLLSRELCQFMEKVDDAVRERGPIPDTSGSPPLPPLKG